MTEQNSTPQQPQKKPVNNYSGYLLIVLGIVGIVTRFVGDSNWNNVGILKLIVSIIVLLYGLWTVFFRKK